MSVVTLCARREKSAYNKRTWAIRINGLVYSNRAKFIKNHPGFIEAKTGELILTGSEDAELKEALDDKLLPIYYITAYLKFLKSEFAYRTICSTSGAANDEELWFIWTMES